MHDLENVKIKVKNYKCFGEEEVGFDTILSINLIIGRNSSGKSALIDLIEYAKNSAGTTVYGHKGREPEFFLTDNLTKEDVKRAFDIEKSDGTIGAESWEFFEKWVGSPLTCKLGNGNFTFVSIDPPLDEERFEGFRIQLANQKYSPFRGKIFKRLLSDRDIVPEPSSSPSVAANGQGATNTIRQFLLNASLPTKLVEETLLTHLNSIFEPDASFTDITVQEIGNGKWEVYLGEAKKGRIPLSLSGSGLKTILLILVFLHLVPHIEQRELNRYLFGFEEIENNLHPALQRRLFLYLRNFALEQGCVFFLTTHSNVVIDLFSGDKEAQILHVTHDGEKASVARAVTYVENRGILDDLDVRASDLLQANAIVWIEGPSDRRYFNRWVELWADGELREGVHYQSVSYGGSLHAHLSAKDPDIDVDDLVNILKVNRNAILLIDSDRKNEDEDINETKKRLVNEIEGMDGIAWVTAGKEMENYIPVEALRNHYSEDSLKPIERFENFSAYLDQVASGEGNRFLRDKVLYAKKITPYFTKENLDKVLDLNQKLDAICNRIREWNGL